MSQKGVYSLVILIGFSLVAGALYFANNKTVVAVVSEAGQNLEVKRSGDYAWTYGSKDAETVIVEFSDFQCPYCSKVHPVLKDIVDASEGAVAWQYRHFPLPSHKKAELSAAYSECVGRLLGEDAFWLYTDHLFANQRIIDDQFLHRNALDLGVEEEAVLACVASDEIKGQIALDLATVRALGGSGTPFSVIVREDGEVIPVRGALPEENWRALLTQANDE